MNRKRHAKAAIIIWSVVLALAIGIFVLCTSIFQRGGFDMFFGGNRDSFVVVKEETVTQTIRSVDAEWISGRLSILQSEGDQVLIKQKGAENFPEDQKFSYTVDDGKLTLRDMRGRGWNVISFGRRAGDLELYLPKREYDSLTIRGTSAEIAADTGKLMAQQARVDSVSGDVRLTGDFGSLSVNTTSGEISLPGCNVDGGIFVGSISGNVDLTGISAGNEIKAETTSGEVCGKEIKTGKAEFRSVSGNQEISGTVEQVGMYTTSGSLRMTGDEKLRSVDASSISGSMTLNVADHGFTARFDKVSGSFTCDYPTTQNGSEYTYPGGAEEKASYRFSTTSGSFRIGKR